MFVYLPCWVVLNLFLNWLDAEAAWGVFKVCTLVWLFYGERSGAVRLLEWVERWKSSKSVKNS